MKLTKTQVLEEILESPDLIKIDEFATKHDYHMEVYVIKLGDKYYKFNLEYSYNEGIITFDYCKEIEAIEVRPVKVETTEWEKVTEQLYEKAAEPKNS